MRVAVLGTWHLGCVTAACLAEAGHEVTAMDEDEAVVDDLRKGKAPLYEPGLDELLQQGLQAGSLTFSTPQAAELADRDVLWVTYDTPVDDEDRADCARVVSDVQRVIGHLPPGAVVVVSSQLPVGSVRELESFAARSLPKLHLEFACAPENLRLGQALQVFRHPDRVVIGVRSARGKELVQELLAPLDAPIEWMSVESAEMTKHAVNAFLATSISWANEVASLCELVGADAKEVERGLKTEARIGSRAYVSPGGPFAGGTLARDLAYLVEISSRAGLRTPLLESVGPSNRAHKGWARRRLERHLGPLAGVPVALWGLTYKSGTSTLRRSWMVELAEELLDAGAVLAVCDPAVRDWPAAWSGRAHPFSSPLAAVADARVLVIGTNWPEFRSAAAALARPAAHPLVVLDPNRFLPAQDWPASISYHAVGAPDSIRGH
jgi:UDPglucose 6-dehydrogenase